MINNTSYINKTKQCDLYIYKKLENYICYQPNEAIYQKIFSEIKLRDNNQNNSNRLTLKQYINWNRGCFSSVLVFLLVVCIGHFVAEKEKLYKRFSANGNKLWTI